MKNWRTSSTARPERVLFLLALRWAHQVAVLERGVLQFCGAPEEAFSSGVLEEVFGVKLGRLRTEKGWQYYYD